MKAKAPLLWFSGNRRTTFWHRRCNPFSRNISAGQNALQLELALCKELQQRGLKLAGGEQYCIGGWVRTENFKPSPQAKAAFYVHNSDWSKEVKTPFFPADTNGKWVRLERCVTMPDSQGDYVFTIWGPGAKGTLEVANPYILPLSVKARDAAGK